RSRRTSIHHDLAAPSRRPADPGPGREAYDPACACQLGEPPEAGFAAPTARYPMEPAAPESRPGPFVAASFRSPIMRKRLAAATLSLPLLVALGPLAPSAAAQTAVELAEEP